MCNIAILKAGVTIPYEKVENVCFNNPHGFGLILKDTDQKKLQVIKKCHKDGNDPKEIFDLLEDNKDVERYLHVRWRTEGPINEANTHPFSVYSSNSKDIYFMHNGTLQEFKPRTSTTYEAGKNTVINHEPDMSDSRKFAEEFLTPYLLTLSGENGKADISDPFFMKVIDKFWSYNSRGVLVCNNQEPVLINQKDWKELDFGGGKFLSSNNDYWEKVTRGPVFEKRKKEAEEKERREREERFQNTSSHNTNGRNVTNLKDIDLKPIEIITEDLSNIFEDFNIFSEEGTATLSNLTALELKTFCERDHESAAALLVHITSMFNDLYKRKLRMIKYIKELKENGKTEFSEEDEKDISNG